jgi:magnesium transporter
VLSAFPHGPLRDALWIDLFDPTPEEVAMVEAEVGLAVPSRAALSEIETSSRLRCEGGVLYLSTPIVANADTPEPELSPLGFVLSDRVLVTERFSRLRVFDAVALEVGRLGRPSASAVFTLLLEAMVDRAADLLEASSADLDRISRETFRNGDTHGGIARANRRLRLTLRDLGRQGERMGHIRSSLLGVGRIVPYASEMGREWIGPEHKARLNAARADVLSLADYQAHLENKTQFLLDAVLGFINTEQNDLFKVLTIVSVVGVPPTLVASIYGMNFVNIPELHWSLGYPYALGLIVLTTVAPMLWFKWKGWW